MRHPVWRATDSNLHSAAVPPVAMDQRQHVELVFPRAAPRPSRRSMARRSSPLARIAASARDRMAAVCQIALSLRKRCRRLPIPAAARRRRSRRVVGRGAKTFPAIAAMCRIGHPPHPGSHRPQRRLVHTLQLAPRAAAVSRMKPSRSAALIADIVTPTPSPRTSCACPRSHRPVPRARVSGTGASCASRRPRSARSPRRCRHRLQVDRGRVIALVHRRHALRTHVIVARPRLDDARPPIGSGGRAVPAIRVRVW
jgi:hypothetical protein